MPTISFEGTFVAAVARGVEQVDIAGGAVELIVVFDGDPPPTPEWLVRAGVRVIASGDRRGPARARNLAAGRAEGDVLLFVDADVELAADALARIRARFAADPDLVAVFGCYDDEPRCTGVVSRFRNLLHHHTHATHPGAANTFWSGCGAIRRAEFMEMGGFDEGFRFPSVEDIELGMRITEAGGRVLLDPTIRCKHAKSWSLVSMVYTDIVHRARPWTHLMAARRTLAPVLNVDWRNRTSGVLVVAALTAALLSVRWPPAGWGAGACLAVLTLLNMGFYRLCLRKRGFRFMLASMALHWLYFLYSSITFGLIVIGDLLMPTGSSSTCERAADGPTTEEPAGDPRRRRLPPR
jgi:glycosyltransferase involved in cell wall biosynthesis